MYRNRLEIVFCSIVLLFLALLIPTGCARNGSRAPDKIPSSQVLSESIQSLVNEGSNYFKKGDFNKSQEIYQIALEKARLVKDELGIGTSLFWLGYVYLYGYQDYQKALEYFSESLQYFQKIKYLEGETFVLAGIFDVYKGTGDDEKALETINKWLPLSENLLTRDSELKKPKIFEIRALAYWYKADLQRKRGEFSKALQNYRLATSDFLKIDNFELAGKTLWVSGDVLRINMGLILDAIESYEESSSLLQKAGKLIEANRVRISLGLSYIDSWNFKESFLVFDDVLKFAEKEESSDLLARANYGLAAACYATDKLYSSLGYCRVALDEFRKGNLKDNGLKADIFYLKGKLLRSLGQYDRAFEDLYSASVYIRKFNNKLSKSMEALILKELSDLYKWFGDHKVSIKYCKRALHLFEETGNTTGQIEAMVSLVDSFLISEEFNMDETEKIP